jgi:hypothetical protein
MDILFRGAHGTSKSDRCIKEVEFMSAGNTTISHRIWRTALWVVPILLVTLFPVRINGQVGAMQAAGEDTAAHSRQKVTGCLQKGDEPGGFVLSGDDGKVWELTAGSGVKLAEHVDHKVAVTGLRFHQSSMQEAKREHDEKKEAGGKEYADLKVESLEMVSDSCK